MKFLVSSCYLAAIALVSSKSIADYLIFDPPNALSLVDYQDKPAVFQVKVKPGILKDYQKLQVTYRGENMNFDKCSLEFDASNFDKFQPVTISGAAIFNMGTPGSKSFDMDFQVFCSDGSCRYRGRGYRINRTFSSSAVCKIWGDPHFIDFNGRNFDYQGKGYFLLTKTPRLVVHGIFDPIRNGQFSITREVSFNYMGTAYSVFLLSDKGRLVLKRISYNDQHPVKPIMDNPATPKSIIFNFPDGSQIMTYLNRTRYIEIKLPSYYKGKTEGLCGKYDGKSSYENGDKCRIQKSHYLANRAYSWPALPPIKYASKRCPLLRYPKVPTRISTSESTSYKFETVNGTVRDIPNDYVTIKVEDIPGYVESEPAENYANQNPVRTIKKAAAEARCIKVLQVPGCPSLLARRPFIRACITDIIGGGSMEFAEASRIAYMSACKTAAKSYEQVGNEQTKSACKSIQRVLGFGSNACPSNCNGRGTCSPTGCVCSDGFSGYDCSIAPALVEANSTDSQLGDESGSDSIETTAIPMATPSATTVTPTATPALTTLAPSATPAATTVPNLATSTSTSQSNLSQNRFGDVNFLIWLLNRYPQLAPYLSRFMRSQGSTGDFM